MIRKLVKNTYQLKLNIPSELIKKLGLNENSRVEIREVETPDGVGFIVLKVKDQKMKVKKEWIR